MRTITLVATVVLAIGCSEAAVDEEQAFSSNAVIGGEAESGDPAVVLITYDVTKADGSTLDTLCSGTLISPTAVLTAAHCATAPAGAKFSNYRVHLGKKVVGARLVAHPESNRRGPDEGYDVAVALLDSPAPSSIAPIRMFTGALKQEYVGYEVRVVGFGRTDAADTASNGKKHAKVVTITALDEGTFDVSKGPCKGDSGGPLLSTSVKTNEPIILGVVSNGPKSCSKSKAARIDLVRDFVEATAGL